MPSTSLTRSSRQRKTQSASEPAASSLDDGASAVPAAAAAAAAASIPAAPSPPPKMAGTSASDGMDCDQHSERFTAAEKEKGPARPQDGDGAGTGEDDQSAQLRLRKMLRLNKCNRCWKPLPEPEDNKQSEGKHLHCYIAEQIVHGNPSDIKLALHFGVDDADGLAGFCKLLIPRIYGECSIEEPEEIQHAISAPKKPRPVAAPLDKLSLGDSRILENVHFFEQIFSTVQIWQHFGGDLLADKELQQKLVVKLLEEIGQVFADSRSYMPDVQLYSLSAHLVGVLRWLAKGTADLCSSLHGDDLLQAMEAYWQETSIKQIMLGMTRHSRWQVEERDLCLWQQPPPVRASLAPDAYMAAATRLEELIYGSSTACSDNAVKIHAMLSGINARTRVYDERPISYSTLKIQRTVKQTKTESAAPDSVEAGAGDQVEAGVAADDAGEKKKKKTKKEKEPEPVVPLSDWPAPEPSAPFDPEVAAKAAAEAKAKAEAAAAAKASAAGQPARAGKRGGKAPPTTLRKQRKPAQRKSGASASSSSKKPGTKRSRSAVDEEDEVQDWEEEGEQDSDARPVKSRKKAKGKAAGVTTSAPAPTRASRSSRAAAANKSYREAADDDEAAVDDQAADDDQPEQPARRQRLQPSPAPLQTLSPNKGLPARHGGRSVPASPVPASPARLSTASPAPALSVTSAGPRVAPRIVSAAPSALLVTRAGATSTATASTIQTRADAASLPVLAVVPKAAVAAAAAAAANPTIVGSTEGPPSLPAKVESGAGPSRVGKDRGPAGGAAANGRSSSLRPLPDQSEPEQEAAARSTSRSKRVGALSEASASTSGAPVAPVVPAKRTRKEQAGEQNEAPKGAEQKRPAPAKKAKTLAVQKNEQDHQDAQTSSETQVVHKLYISTSSIELRAAVKRTPNMTLTEDVAEADYFVLNPAFAPANCIQAIISDVEIISEADLADWMAYYKDRDGPTKGAFATPAYETKGGCDLSAAVQNRHKKPDFLAGRFFALADDVIGPEKKNLAGDITRYIEAAGGAMADPAKTRPARVETIYRKTAPSKGKSIHVDAFMKMLYAQKA